MKRLWKTLLPFASDNNGVCSVLYDCNALVLINDRGAAVTRAYRFAEQRDEPQRSVCRGIRLGELAFTMGRSDDFLDDYLHTLNSLPERPELLVLLHSAVSSLIGLDIKDLAQRLEEVSGIPSIALETSGNRYYDSGISAALDALYEKFCGAPVPPNERQGVNLLGLNTLDYPCASQREMIENIVRAEGYMIQGRWGMCTELSAFAGLERAALNIVVSAAGLPLAERMQSEFGTPYLALHELSAWDEQARNGEVPKSGKIVVVGEQISSCVLRRLLRRLGADAVTVAGFFSMAKKYMQPQDRHLTCEEDLTGLLQDLSPDMIIGDPILAPLLPHGCALLPFPHNALSGGYTRSQERPNPFSTEWLQKAFEI